MDNGIILIDKPPNMTSFGVVARIRRVLSTQFNRRIKVGHTGTLDPFATGLLILVVGKECKNAEKYTKLDKVYEATVCLGWVSSTGDTEGEISGVSDKVPTREEIEVVLKSFIGEITQRPPIYSAVKIGGERAYKLARTGERVKMPLRKIKIHSIEIISYDYPELKIRTNVSSGTYIRTLAEDIGKVLGVGGYCKELRRLSIGEWNVDDAKKLEDFGVDS